MLKTGLCSITFRKLAPTRIVEVATEAGIDGIEWGGDVHVPHGDIGMARSVANLTQNAGLDVSSYGSYYRLGASEDERLPFERVLETAVALGAPTIRVWAGTHGSIDTKPEHRERIEEEARKIADMAAREAISIGLEYHYNTLTDSLLSTINLLKAVNHANLGTYWQPWPDRRTADVLEEIPRLEPWLMNLHVYTWETATGGGWKRLPFDYGEDFWKQAFARAANAPGDRWAILEFVRDDEPDQFLKDARALRKILDTPDLST